MNRRIVEKIFDIRANNLIYTELIDDTQASEFLNSLIEAIKRYSNLLQKAKLVSGKFNTRYTFEIEDDANIIQLLDNGNIQTKYDIVSSWECAPKPLGLGIMVPKLVSLFYENDIENIITNMIYKPFVKSIESNVISGAYFDKPLFNTQNTITGTNNFEGLLKLVRKLKDTYDDGCIVGNNSVIEELIDTIGVESYFTEYLMKGTIEGVQIISNKNAPENVDGKFLVGFNPNKIGLLLVPQIQVRKISIVGRIDNFFHIYGCCNGGDIFNTAIGLKEAV
jgi:hypothetical protein